MNIPDKLSYTKGEKTSEVICGAVCAAIMITELVLLILRGIALNTAVILIGSLFTYGILSMCAVYPQHTNVFTYPEKCTEAKFRTARRVICWSRLIITAALFAAFLF